MSSRKTYTLDSPLFRGDTPGIASHYSFYTIFNNATRPERAGTARLPAASSSHPAKDKIITRVRSIRLILSPPCVLYPIRAEESSVIKRHSAACYASRALISSSPVTTSLSMGRCRGECRVEIIHSLIFHRRSINVKTGTRAWFSRRNDLSFRSRVRKFVRVLPHADDRERPKKQD